jgi:hypothetical protein
VSKDPGITFEFVSNVPATRARVEQGLRRALDRIAIRWQKEAKIAAPVDLGRLRASIAFSTPNIQALHTESYRGGVVQYMPPPPPNELTAQVGSNVEYARAVHEGFSGVVTVKAHKRTIKKVFGKPITPRAIQVEEHTRRMSRTPNKFIETPGRDLLPRAQQIVAQEIQRATVGQQGRLL